MMTLTHRHYSAMLVVLALPLHASVGYACRPAEKSKPADFGEVYKEVSAAQKVSRAKSAKHYLAVLAATKPPVDDPWLLCARKIALIELGYFNDAQAIHGECESADTTGGTAAVDTYSANMVLWRDAAVHDMENRAKSWSRVTIQFPLGGLCRLDIADMTVFDEFDDSRSQMEVWIERQQQTIMGEWTIGNPSGVVCDFTNVEKTKLEFGGLTVDAESGPDVLLDIRSSALVNDGERNCSWVPVPQVKSGGEQILAYGSYAIRRSGGQGDEESVQFKEPKLTYNLKSQPSSDHLTPPVAVVTAPPWVWALGLELGAEASPSWWGANKGWDVVSGIELTHRRREEHHWFWGLQAHLRMVPGSNIAAEQRGADLGWGSAAGPVIYYSVTDWANAGVFADGTVWFLKDAYLGVRAGTKLTARAGSFEFLGSLGAEVYPQAGSYSHHYAIGGLGLAYLWGG
ncbi:MAG TPA: hypothetical protein VIV60_04190 [Polyangiaceae bacterium]